ncbi:hypothetical protein O3P69_020681 [Scylla paramamosain]|uniref:Uncharacterized protein n=1 Tax=Scylla paramamosain TaxID=85552 RepID=A0AAW0TN76_SCYPA
MVVAALSLLSCLPHLRSSPRKEENAPEQKRAPPGSGGRTYASKQRRRKGTLHRIVFERNIGRHRTAIHLFQPPRPGPLTQESEKSVSMAGGVPGERTGPLPRPLTSCGGKSLTIPKDTGLDHATCSFLHHLRMRRLVLKVQVWVVSPCLASLPRMETGRVTALSFLLNIRLSASVGLPELQISQFDKRKGKHFPVGASCLRDLVAVVVVAVGCRVTGATHARGSERRRSGRDKSKAAAATHQLLPTASQYGPSYYEYTSVLAFSPVPSTNSQSPFFRTSQYLPARRNPFPLIPFHRNPILPVPFLSLSPSLPVHPIPSQPFLAPPILPALSFPGP